ncbi:hypothetical protein LZ32DRAFT_67829 [Colletotrichum eremochloae]|nr:hypothetical protein LZ32DRAFT_67829 [Colletotrichum eremochloae]
MITKSACCYQAVSLSPQRAFKGDRPSQIPRCSEDSSPFPTTTNHKLKSHSQANANGREVALVSQPAQLSTLPLQASVPANSNLKVARRLCSKYCSVTAGHPLKPFDFTKNRADKGVDLQQAAKALPDKPHGQAGRNARHALHTATLQLFGICSSYQCRHRAGSTCLTGCLLTRHGISLQALAE